MKKAPIICLSFALILTGCTGATATISDGSDTLMTIGDKTYTREDEYNALKITNGESLAVSLTQFKIADKEIKTTKAMRKQAKEQVASLKEENEDYQEQIEKLGYKNTKEYINKLLIPSYKVDKLTEKYFTDAKATIKKTYKPSKVQIIQCDNKANAKKALKAIKNGTDISEVADQYASSDGSYSGDEILITTNTTDLPTRLINKCYKAKKTGLINEVFDDTASGTTYTYVAVVISNDYKEIKDDVISELGSDDTITTDCLVYYLKKNNFEIHDQDIFDSIRTNNPSYIVNHPELAEEADD